MLDTSNEIQYPEVTGGKTFWGRKRTGRTHYQKIKCGNSRSVILREHIVLLLRNDSSSAHVTHLKYQRKRSAGSTDVLWGLKHKKHISSHLGSVSLVDPTTLMCLAMILRSVYRCSLALLGCVYTVVSCKCSNFISVIRDRKCPCWGDIQLQCICCVSSSPGWFFKNNFVKTGG